MAGQVELVRNIVGKQLHLKARLYGGTDTDVSSLAASESQNVVDPGLVTAIRTVITVSDIDVSACATNATPTASRARIYGEFFNTTAVVPDSSLDDVSAQVRLIRSSDSTDPQGVMLVQGVVNLCNDATCTGTTTLGLVELGTASVGQAVTVQLQWDKANKQFLFARDGGASLAAPYTVADTLPAATPAAGVGLRNQVPNCTAAVRPSGFVEASFDDFSVNRSAVPQ